MRVNRIVVLEPARQLVEHRTGGGPGVYSGVVALQRADERFGHAVRLRAFDRRGAGRETDVAGEPAGIVGGVTAAIVGQPLDGRGQLVDLAEPVLDAKHHEVANVFGADPGRGRDIAHGFPIAAVEGEGDTDLL